MPRFTVNTPRPEPSHSTRRRACSSSLTSQSIDLFSASMIILSPSWTSAIGPPRRASGTTWPASSVVSASALLLCRATVPMIKPCDAPEKRPSVISAVDPASPAPINAPVGPCAQQAKSATKEVLGIRPSRAYLTSTEEGPDVQCTCAQRIQSKSGSLDGQTGGTALPLACRGRLWGPDT